MKRTLLPALALILLAACSGDQQPLAPAALERTLSSAQAVAGGGASTVVTTQTVPVYRTPYASCLGESLTVTGTTEIHTRTTTDGNGGMHVQMFVDYQGWTAVGQTSGKTWRLVGKAPASYNESGSTSQMTFTWAGGQVFVPEDASMPALLFYGPEHFTVNAQGEVTVEFNKYEYFVCRGN